MQNKVVFFFKKKSFFKKSSLIVHKYFLHKRQTPRKSRTFLQEPQTIFYYEIFY